MEYVIPVANDNDGTNKDFVEVIHDKLWNAGITSVFGKVDSTLENYIVNIQSDNGSSKVIVKKGSTLERPQSPSKDGYKFKGWFYKKDGIEKEWNFEKDVVEFDMELCLVFEAERPIENPTPMNGSISLTDFLKKYGNNTFKKDTYKKFRLVGFDGYEKYSTKYFDSAFAVAWDFVTNLLSERGIAFIQEVTIKHEGIKNLAFISHEEYLSRKEQNKYKRIEVPGLENYYMYRHYGQYDWINSVLRARLLEYGLPIDKFKFEYVIGNVGETEDTVQSDDLNKDLNTTSIGGSITGPISLGGNRSVQEVKGRFPLKKFLSIYGNATFQSKSCTSIKLIGVNGCEKYSMKEDTYGRAFSTARELVFHFAMKRLDEMGMAYIEIVNTKNRMTNPIFITTEEHNVRKAKKMSVNYKAVTSKAVCGYSMCVHYSEYNWLKNSFIKQINALELPIENFYIELE